MKDVSGQQINRLIFLSFLFVFAFLNTSSVFAGPNRTTYQAKIVKPDGYPLEASTVNFKFTILDPAGSCILYSETYSSVNMSGTGGLISFALGSGVKTYPTSATTTFEQVFSNITPSLTCDTGGPANYSPSASDTRKIVMQFHDGNGWQTLPAMSINAVPYAMYANNAQTLNGKADTDFVQVAALSTCGSGEALSYNGVGFSCLAIPTPEAVSASAVVAALGYTPADGASVTALSSSLSSTNTTVSSVSSTVASVSSTVFSVSSTVSSLSNTVSNLSTSVSSLSASMAAITSSQWVTSGTKISYSAGSVGIGTTNPTSSLAVGDGTDNSETITLNALNYAWYGWYLGGVRTAFIQSSASEYTIYSQTSGVPMTFYTSSSERMRISASGSVGIGTVNPVTKLDVVGGLRISMEAAACSAPYAGTLRYNSGTVEYCNGTSWLPFGVAGAGITNINGSTSGSQTFATGITGTVFNISSANGVHTFNIPLAASSSVTAGLLSNADYLTFTNKLNATSAAVISALGYTPLNSSVSGTYVVKANNLSDLASATVARTNLGLGSLATLNYLDLGSALASGTLSVASLPSVGSGITSGAQYTKVTVDGKGRVVSGAQLSSSDVVTALGYTPGAAASGVTSLNGSTSQTQTFANGTAGNAPAFNTSNGVHTLNIPLASATGSVTAGLISNADYLTFTNKITSSAAAIAQVLGYTPASATALANYAVRSNNLSDLASATVARTNLGLGSLATLNYLDLGSALASGTLSVARLPAFSGDATSSLGSSVLTLASVGAGVTSGAQYTKVTVDGKGRVVSGAQLSVTDVTTALGYTPASASASTQWTTSGSAIFYNTGNVGIGTASPADRLTVAHTSHAKLRITGDGDTDEASLYLFESSPANAESGFQMVFEGDNVVGGNSLNFNSYTAGVSATRMTVLRDTGYIGIGTSAPVTRLEVSGGVKISMESVACSSGYAGTLRYNGGNVEYCNGSTWTAFGAATVGVNSLNGSTSQTQTFANGTTGTAPAFVTANGVHTLNIPYASAGSVTAGLISNADYTSFANKITSSAAAISQVLGYAPVSMTTLSNYVLKANNLSDLTDVATARTNLGLGAFATASTIDLSTASATGILSVARLPSFTGDVTSVSGSNSLTVDGLQGRSVLSTAPTTNQVLAYNGSAWAPATNVSSQWTTSATTIYYNGGNVGIGTAAPINLLHTHATAGNTVFRMSNASTGTTGGDGFVIQQTATDVNFMNYEAGAMGFQTSALERMRITSAGAVGINTTAPGGLLHVKGSGQAGPGNGTSFNILRLGNASALDFGEYAGGNPWIQANSLDGVTKLPLAINPSGGSVGVGVTSPLENLDIAGNIYVRGDNVFFSHDGGTNTNNDYINFDDANGQFAAGSAGFLSLHGDQSRDVATWSNANVGIAAGSSYFNGVVGIGVSAPTKTLDVNGSINAGGQVAETFTFAIDGTAQGTWAIGSLSNNGTVVHVGFEMYVHNNSTIDALRFEASLPTYSNGTFYSGWQELPVAFGSTAWNGQKNYVIDVLRSSASSGNPIYFRVRNKGGNGSSSTMKIRMTYNSDQTFTRITHVNTVATAFNSGTAAAGGPVDGMYGALEYSFPVAIGQGWRPADNSGLFIKNSGYVGIGTSSPSVELEVSGTVKAAAYLYTSDRRLKKDIVTLPDALTKALQLRGVNFVWRNTEEKTVGFIAQEVEAVYPELVKTDKQSGFKAVQYGNIVAILVEALKQENKERVEAQNRCEAQVSQVQRNVASVEEKSSTRMNQLEKENKALKERLDRLEKLLLKK